MSRYLAAYDVSHSSRRAKIARVLGEYGVRLQLSVFEIDIEPDEIETLRRHVGALLGRTDRFDLVPVDCDLRRARLSWQRAPAAAAVIFF
jgi:CRISPR-associated endonuclease Cas2